jgi:hypothetical protein
MALEADALTAVEQKQLTEAFDDLVRDTPRTPVAVSRTRKLLSKAGKTIADGVRDILVDIASEAVKKQLWP